MTIKDVLYGVSKGVPAVIPNNYVANFIDLNPNTEYWGTPTCASKNIEVDINDNVIVKSGFPANSAGNQYFARYAVYDKTGNRVLRAGNSYSYQTKQRIYSVKKSAIDGAYYTLGAKTNTYEPVYIGKHDATGAWIWGYRFGWDIYVDVGGNNPIDAQPCMAIDTLDNCYVCGTDVYSTSLRITKITPAGVISWTKVNQASFWRIAGIQLMSNGNLCIVGHDNGLQTFIAIIDTSGTIISSVKYSIPDYPSNYHKPHTFCIDANNNIYIGFNRVSNTGTYGIKLVKFNSSGVFQWGKQVIENLEGYGAYVAVNPNPPYDCYITGASGHTYAFSSSGTLLWKRTMGGGDYPSGIGVDSKEGLILQQGFFIGRFPTDGTKTGTYAVPGGGNFTWSVSSQTITDITSFPTVTSNFTLIAGTDFSIANRADANILSPQIYTTPYNSKTIF